MYYLVNFAILCRPPGTPTYSDDDLMARALEAAASVEGLLSLVEELLADAAPSSSATSITIDDDGAAPPEDPAVAQRKSMRRARKGEWKKSLSSLVPPIL
jgi:hypothetical protein